MNICRYICMCVCMCMCVCVCISKTAGVNEMEKRGGEFNIHSKDSRSAIHSEALS